MTVGGLAEGATLGPYTLEQQLGRGGMGAVFAARHGGTGRRVALKVIVPRYADSAGAIERFRREAKALGRLQHPHVVDVTDFGSDADRLYLVMEHLGGASLRSELKTRGPLPMGEVLDIVDQVASALTAAHAVGIVHRDLKPDNVQLVPTGTGKALAKVLDFGVAKLSGAEDVMPSLAEHEETEPGVAHSAADTPTVSATLTEGGAIVGTPPYMSPEQFLSKPIDARSDVYALAALTWECLTGAPPRKGNTVQLFAQHLAGEPVVLEHAGVPLRVAHVIARGLAAKPEDRPDPAVFAAVLRVAAAGADALYDYAADQREAGDRVRTAVALVGGGLASIVAATVAYEMDRSGRLIVAFIALAPWFTSGALALWRRRRLRPWEVVLGPIGATLFRARLGPVPTRLVVALAARPVLGLLLATIVLLGAGGAVMLATDIEAAFARTQPRVSGVIVGAVVVLCVVVQSVLMLRALRAAGFLAAAARGVAVPVAVRARRRVPSGLRAALLAVAIVAFAFGVSRTVLHRSLALHAPTLTKYLLAQGVDARPGDDFDPMSVAVESRASADVIEQLVRLRSEVDETQHLERAIEMRNEDALRALTPDAVRVDELARTRGRALLRAKP